MKKTNIPLKVLHLMLSIRETSAPYNEHCLPLAHERSISICTYFRSDVVAPPEITVFEGDGSLVGFLRTLTAALDQIEPDVVHAHSPHVGLLLLLAQISRGGRNGPATVCTVHNSFQNYRLRNKLLFLPVFAMFRSIVFCSRASFESFPALYKRLAPGSLISIQNGIDTSRVDRIVGASRKRPENGNFTVATVGRIIEIKNPLTVLSAFERSADPASRLVFVGDGNLRDELSTRRRALGLERQVELTGLIPRDHVYEELTSADLFVSASWGEGLPIAALEAMACRCPVVLSDIPPHREITGRADFIPLIPPDDVAGFAREFERFRRMPVPQREAIGEKCRSWVDEHFSLTGMHRRYEQVYARALDRH